MSLPLKSDETTFDEFLQELPADFRELAVEFKAFCRARKIKTPEQLLRVAMSYCGHGHCPTRRRGTCFNPRPPITAGESRKPKDGRQRGNHVSIRARQLRRANHVVRVDFPTWDKEDGLKMKRWLNAVRTGGLVPLRNLSGPSLQVLEGAL